ncbi:hypothetical protein R3P38DRAFT_3241554 [Favolaschia claudopus]|uniref:Uncharacterized protein n=1 Tax=Favolaschia claudopus TaxID=2862362 RepID=A0AAV9Z5F4_9AGAR
MVERRDRSQIGNAPSSTQEKAARHRHGLLALEILIILLLGGASSLTQRQRNVYGGLASHIPVRALFVATLLITNLIPADIPERSLSPPLHAQAEGSRPDDDDSASDEMRADPPIGDDEDGGNQAEEVPPPPKRPRVTVEEVEDEIEQWDQEFLAEFQAGAVLEECKTQFEKLREEKEKEGLNPWYSFDRKEDWEIGRWLMTSGVSQSKIDEYLKLDAVRTGLKPSFHNKRAFLKHIDALPHGPEWYCQIFEITGDEVDGDGKKKTESLELWYRNSIDCIREFLSNPAFKEKMNFVPRRFFRNPDGTNREWSEMWTAEWWWEIQQRLPASSTICPIIIASDKTQLTRFSGDQQAWPVYLTIGNIDKETRRSASSYATILLGYIPVSKFAIVDEKERSSITHQFFHNSMRAILEPLVEAGKKGETMDCADGFVRRMFPILAAYIEAPELYLDEIMDWVAVTHDTGISRSALDRLIPGYCGGAGS